MAPSSLSRTVAGVGLLAPLSLCVTSATLAQGAATLEVTPSGAAPAGSTVMVKWSGPNAPGDYITVVRKGAPVFEYLGYKPTSDGRTPVNPVSIVLPAEPGAYEIRYLFSNPRRVLAVVPYEVTADRGHHRRARERRHQAPGSKSRGLAPTTEAIGSRSSRPVQRAGVWLICRCPHRTP